MGSELKIVDVGNGNLQFKFSSKYQSEWVENSGPWNFENNLLLLCRWRKGLSTANMVFTHSPFWVQLWGLPFELMSEDVGREVGNSLGRFPEMDKRACQSDQALFMHFRVELPIDKPLRRGGNVVSLDGEKFWVNFKYERLPTFCFLCGKLGHDDKHCLVFPNWQSTPKQYGEWLKAGGVFKGNSSRQRSTYRDRRDEENENITKGNGQSTDHNLHSDVADDGGDSAGSGSIRNSKSAEHMCRGDGSEAQMCQTTNN